MWILCGGTFLLFVLEGCDYVRSGGIHICWSTHPNQYNLTVNSRRKGLLKNVENLSEISVVIKVEQMSQGQMSP